MYIAKRKRFIALAICLLGMGCGDNSLEQQPAPTGGEQFQPPEFSSQHLPVIEPPHNDCLATAEELSITDWVSAADNIVIGTIKEISETRDMGWVPLSDHEGEPVLPAESCQTIGGGFRVVLDNITTLSGESLEEVEVRFGTELPWAHNPEIGFPADESEFIEKRLAGLQPGMTIGGALFYIEEYGIYSFESAKYQPVFEVADNTVLFQQYYNHTPKVCAGYIPPVSSLSGLSIDEFSENILQARHDVDAESRAQNPLRHFLQLGAPMGTPERHPRWFSTCIPLGYTVIEGDCQTDADCEPGLLCHYEEGKCKPDAY